MIDPTSSVSKSPQSAEIDSGVVLLVSPFYRPEVGGITEVADRLFHLLNGAGIETHLLVTGPEEPHGRIVPDGKVHRLWRTYVASYMFHEIGARSIAGTFRRGVPLLWQLWRFIRKMKIRTVVLIYPIDNAWPFVVLKKILRFRLVASLHGNDIWHYETRPSLYRWITRSVLRQANSITVPAVHLVTKAKEISGDPALTVRLIPNYVDTGHFVPKPRMTSETRPFTIVHVSNFQPKKRVLDILEAFSLVTAHYNCQLVLVGPANEMAKARARILGVDNQVRFCGVQTEIRPFLWEADLFVMASDEESGPIALLEAMACELPFVSTGWGVAAVLPPGECGIVVPNRSPSELAKAIKSLIEQPEKRERMGKQGRNWAKCHFNKTQYLESHLAVLL